MGDLNMADAAYAAGIPPGFQVAAGYFGGADAYHVWTPEDWARFPGYRLPIYVPGVPGSGPEDGGHAVGLLHELGVPVGAPTVLDMETRKDALYVENYGAVLNQAGYKVWVYGSLDFVFGNPPLQGWWVADYTGRAHMVDHPKVRATQWASLPTYDHSDVLAWTVAEMWHG
jgi:hypothetical protein